MGWIISKVNHFLWQVGKGLSLDAKAQKLAFQHWIEAVSMIVLFYKNFMYDQLLLIVYYSFLILIGLDLKCRLIHAIAMGTTCIIIMKNGAKLTLVSHSFIGEIIFFA